MLNDLYTHFDNIIDNHDVYKVGTEHNMIRYSITRHRFAHLVPLISSGRNDRRRLHGGVRSSDKKRRRARQGGGQDVLSHSAGHGALPECSCPSTAPEGPHRNSFRSDQEPQKNIHEQDARGLLI